MQKDLRRLKQAHNRLKKCEMGFSSFKWRCKFGFLFERQTFQKGVSLLCKQTADLM